MSRFFKFAAIAAAASAYVYLMAQGVYCRTDRAVDAVEKATCLRDHPDSGRCEVIGGR